MKIHCIGIGGIGVSALAQYYLEKGHQVSGSDLVASELTEYLQKKGIQIFIGQKPENIQKDIDLVIYSPAVKPDNPEYQKAQELKIKLQSYPQALGQLTRDYQTIAISGSHGKSTTTAMLALVLVAAGLDPTVIVGTKLREFGNTNYRVGKSKYLVIEACEYDGSFLEYSPHIAVITNIDKEHLDYFKTFANVVKAFRDFILKLPKDGYLVINKDDLGNSKLLPSLKLWRAGKLQKSRVEFKIQNHSLRQPEAKKIKKILKVTGQHNISNALAALQVARILGIKDSVAFKALSQFQGTWRRFEMKEGRVATKKITVVSDYGHHPTEILVTLKAAREKWPKKRIWLIFQPHQYQRTFYLMKDFVTVFRQKKIDQIIITDIYDVAGREEKEINQSVSSEKLVKKIGKKNVSYMPMNEAEQFVKENIKNGEVVIMMGAGDIYKLVDQF